MDRLETSILDEGQPGSWTFTFQYGQIRNAYVVKRKSFNPEFTFQYGQIRNTKQGLKLKKKL